MPDARALAGLGDDQARVRAQAARPQPAALDRRAETLASYAPAGAATVTRAADGLRLESRETGLSIDDTIDAWITRERARVAIEVCRLMEAAR